MSGMDASRAESASADWISTPASTDLAIPSVPDTSGRHIGLAQIADWIWLVPILAVATFLDVYRLTREGYANTYYAAAVKSMLESWHNFFFVSFDPGGFVTVDKPPLGFWLQAASAEIFGFHGWSLMLPEAVAGVLSVAIVYHLVRRVLGQLAGLLAALIMAVTPVAVASNRSNIVDSLLVLSLLLAAWAVVRAVERHSLRWLLLGMLLVGLGFNIKMLQAFLVVPALLALYFFCTKLRWRTRAWHVIVAGIVLLVVSLSWATAVDLTPVSQRPFVGSSQDNSEYNLIFGYNGVERLLPRNFSIFGIHGLNFGFGGRSAARGGAAARPARSSLPSGAQSGGGPGGAGENGSPGVLRLIDQQLGGQAGWLLPLALIAFVVLGWQAKPHLYDNRRQQALMLWGVWLLTAAIFFSVAGFFHAYYLIMLAPPIAALGGAGIATLWHDYRRGNWRGWLLPLALIAVALVQAHLLAPYSSWNRWLTPLILATAALGAAILAAARLVPLMRNHLRRVAGMAAVIGMTGLLLAPAIWSAETTLAARGGLTPSAGPQTGFGGGGRFFNANGRSGSEFTAPAGFNLGSGAPGSGQVDQALISYLLKEQGTTKFLVATPSSNEAAPIILTTGKPVMALGGFSGSDQILTTDQLAKLVSNNTVRFFLLSGGGFGQRIGQQFNSSGNDEPQRYGEHPRGDVADPQFDRNGLGFGQSASLTSWVVANCKVVPSSTWESAQTSGSNGSGQFDRVGGGQLYDCAGARSQS